MRSATSKATCSIRSRRPVGGHGALGGVLRAVEPEEVEAPAPTFTLMVSGRAVGGAVVGLEVHRGFPIETRRRVEIDLMHGQDVLVVPVGVHQHRFDSQVPTLFSGARRRAGGQHCAERQAAADDEPRPRSAAAAWTPHRALLDDRSGVAPDRYRRVMPCGIALGDPWSVRCRGAPNPSPALVSWRGDAHHRR